ncbi:ClpXP protease specificity-enhancing factor SspB, partial [Vibrio parahaemolyticus]
MKLEDDRLHVTLSFNNVKERLVVPIESITTFADPSVNFALQFQSGQNDEDDEDGDEDSPAANAEPGDGKDKPAKDEKRGEVISLDMFRK